MPTNQQLNELASLCWLAGCTPQEAFLALNDHAGVLYANAEIDFIRREMAAYEQGSPEALERVLASSHMPGQ